MKKHWTRNFEIKRRTFLRGLGVAAVSAPFLYRGSFGQDAKRIVIPSYGGSYQEMLEAAYTKPFTKETGIEVVFSGVPDLARLKAQVMSGRPEWDVFEATGSWFPAGSKDNLFVPLDKALIKDSALIVGPKGDYAPFYNPIGGISWKSDRHSDGKVPRTFKQFWDAKTFPGARTLRNRADIVLELALVADGVAPDKLYPLDVDRAFKSLAGIKPFVTKWAESTSQLTTLVQTSEVDYGFNYNGRVKAAQASGIPLEMSFDQTLVANEYIGVVKGTTRQEGAMRFIEFVLRADRQADFATRSSYVPGNRAALAMMSPDAKKWIPDLNSGQHIFQNDDWWADKTAQIQQRFQEFLLT